MLLPPPLRLLVLLALLVSPGCAGYHMGARTLYPPDVETVYVPIFESNSFRRELGERLTEAVVKEIESRSTLKVVSSPDADSVLTGEILRDRKHALVENPNDEPRDIEFDIRIRVSWVDRRAQLIRQEMSIPIPPRMLYINQPAAFVPEGGQSVATGEMESVKRLATQIVDMMEVPW